MVDVFLGATGGPNAIGTGTPNAWFDGSAISAGTVNGLANITWDVGSSVAIDGIRIAWAYGSVLPGGAAAAFAIDGSNTSGAGPWTEVLTDPDPPTNAGVTYPDDFTNTYLFGATYRWWRFRSTTAGNNDIFTVEGLGAVPPGPEPPPYVDPEPGRAIVEIYVTDPDGYRWDEALWDEATWSDDAWVSISEWVIFADVTWGTDRPDAGILSDQKAGQWIIETHDPDRVLDPANADSQFYPLLLPDLPIRLNHATRGVVRTGQVTEVSYSHATRGGRISASDALSRLARAQVPPGTTLGDTFSTRVQDAIDAAGIRTHIAYATTGMWDAPLAEDDPDERRSVWSRIHEAARELLAIAWIDRYTHVRATKWNADHDRGLVIDSSVMVDLQPWVSHDGLYSVVRALDADGVTIEEARQAPLPAYGDRVYDRTDPTIDAATWVTRVLADRANAVLRYRPGTIEPTTAADVDALVRVDLMDIVTLSYPEATPPIEERARVLGMRVRVTDRTKKLPTVLTRWQFTLLTTTVPGEPLVADGGGALHYLVDDADPDEYLYPG